MKKKPGILTRLLLLLNYIFGIALVLAYLASYVNPDQFVHIAFFGLAYPFLLLANILFLLYWIVFGKRYFILPLLLILLGWNHAQRHYQFRGETLDDNKYPVKVLSYNVKNLSNSNYDIEDNLVRQSIIQFLEKEKPQILCMQEFRIRSKDTSQVLGILRKETSWPNVYYKNYGSWSQGIDALILLTKYPIINKGSVVFEDKNNFSLFVDLIIKEDTIRVYNTHYESIRFRHEDYQFVSELTENGQSEQKFSEGSKNIMKKLARAFRKRGKQVEILEEHMQTSPYPIILCGDFNDTPSSYVYRTTSGDMKDAFIESGKGYDNTYAGQLPPMRIDYILCDPKMDIYNYTTHDDIQLSDHYPISCIITLPN